MRILHTSDWHIGRTFHGESVRDHLQTALACIPNWVREHHIDVVAVAGDVFDSTIPAAWAFNMLTELVAEIREAGAIVIISSGNHDSAERLRYMSPLTAKGGVYFGADACSPCTPVVLNDEHGSVRFYPVPYLEPAIVRTRAGESAAEVRTQDQAMQWALQQVREDLNAAEVSASELADALTGKPRSVVLAHCFAAGVRQDVPGADLERDLSAGGLDVVSLDHFAPFDYVALGHIHSRMNLTERIRYSGSPLHYSFSETGAERGAWLVDLDAAGFAGAQWLQFPVPRPLARISGKLDDLLDDADLSCQTDSWLQVTLTDNQRPLDAMSRLRQRFPFTVHLVHIPERSAQDAPRSYRETLAEATSDRDRIIAFLQHVRGGSDATNDANWTRELECIDELLDELAVEAADR